MALIPRVDRLGPDAVTGLGFLSPLTAMLLGWTVVGEALRPLQLMSATIILACVVLGGVPARAVQMKAA